MDPELQIGPVEARVLGVLVEKALTTPEQYPLTLNAVVNGANQKSNRDPVLALAEEEVDAALEGLIGKELARRVFPGNSRVDKYCHTGTSRLKIDPAAMAVLAELCMRGPQTPAELRARAGRMVEIPSPEYLREILGSLLDRGLIRRVPAGQGSRAERVAQILCPDLHSVEIDETAPARSPRPGAVSEREVSSRLAALEGEVERLASQLRKLAETLGEPLD